MATFENIIGFLDSLLGSAVYFPFLLLGVGLFFTLYLGFPQVRFFKHAWGVVTGKYSKDATQGDTTHFQALSTALSGTVGTGNIGGVAFAIFLGGPAALFWMWMTAFLGMTTKFVEVTISHRYRTVDTEGRIAGGPMYYMERGLNMKWLAVFYAAAMVISSFGGGNLPQSNNMASGLETSFGLPTWISGLVLAVLLGLVIIGGIRRIALVAASIVPAMGVLYAIGAVAVAISNLDQIGPSFAAVFQDAFTGSAATGGFLGATFAYAFNRGVNRGLFSNEAGQGSAAVAHASARTDEPVSEGMVSILEPFIDTLVICTLTGLVILSSGVWTEKFETDFTDFDTEYLAGEYTEADPEHVQALFAHLDIGGAATGIVTPFTGTVRVNGGEADLAGITVLHNRSIAEDMRYALDGEPFTGNLEIESGKQVRTEVEIRGAFAPAFGTAYGGSVQAQLFRRVRPVRGNRRAGAVRLLHGDRLVLLRRPRDDVHVRHPFGGSVPGRLRDRVLPGDGGGHVADLADFRRHAGADDASQPARPDADAQGNQIPYERLLEQVQATLIWYSAEAPRGPGQCQCELLSTSIPRIWIISARCSDGRGRPLKRPTKRRSSPRRAPSSIRSEARTFRPSSTSGSANSKVSSAWSRMRNGRWRGPSGATCSRRCPTSPNLRTSFPDSVPVLGYLDDAIMIELVVKELQHEIEAFADFCRYREEEKARNRNPNLSRQEFLDVKRRNLQQRMRRRRGVRRQTPLRRQPPAFSVVLAAPIHE